MKSSKKKRIIKPLFLDKKPQIKLNEILFQRHKYLIEKYSITKKKYNSFMIEYLIYDEKTRLVSLFQIIHHYLNRNIFIRIFIKNKLY